MYQRLVRDEKTKRGIGITFFRADKYTNVIENFQSGTSVYNINNKHSYKTFTKNPPVTLHKNI